MKKAKCDSPHRTDWLRNAKRGVFVHILADTASNTSKINVTPDIVIPKY